MNSAYVVAASTSVSRTKGVATFVRLRPRVHHRLVDRAGQLDCYADAAFIYRCRRFGVSDEAIEDAMAECLRGSG